MKIESTSFEEIRNLHQSGKHLTAYKRLTELSKLEDLDDPQQMVTAASVLNYVGGLEKSNGLVSRAFRLAPDDPGDNLYPYPRSSVYKGTTPHSDKD